MHQAIEAKEGVEIKQENQTLATITLQNYFRLYEKLSGMTGTAQTEAGEFNKVYKVGVVTIPTHRPMIRIDRPDVIYKTEKAKFNAVIEDIAERHAAGQPILVGTVSVENSEILSQLLRRRGIEHAVLNAKFHAQEAQIIALAGRKGGVTVATNMAGRGTDILLGGSPDHLAAAELPSAVSTRSRAPTSTPRRSRRSCRAWKEACEAEAAEVTAAGGLYVLGTERHDSRRIDNQLRGRSGRQGDPGESRFYLSLQDDLMKRFRAGAVEAVMERFNIPEDVPIESKMVPKQIKSAQTQIEGQNAEIRKNVLKYDEVHEQAAPGHLRRAQARARRRGPARPGRGTCSTTWSPTTSPRATSDGYAEDWDLDQLWTSLKRLYPVGITVEELVEEVGGERNCIDHDFLLAQLKEDAHAAYDAREEELGAEAVRELERQVLLAGHRPQVARAPLRDGLPAGRHQPAGVRPARPGGRVPARGLRHVQPDDGGHQGGGRRLPVQPGGPGRGAAHGHRRPEPGSAAAGGASETRHGRDPRQGPRWRPPPQNLQYTAPAIDGEAGAGAPVIQQEQQAPALGIGETRRCRPTRRTPPPAARARTGSRRRARRATARPATRPATAARARSTSAATARPGRSEQL